MKILFVLTPAFNPKNGGVQNTTFKLGRYFTERGLLVSYYSLSMDGHIEAEYGTLLTATKEGKSKNQENLSDLRIALQKIKPNIVINQMPYEKELTQLLKICKVDCGYFLIGCLRNSLFSVVNNLRDTAQQILPSWMFPFADNRIGMALMLFWHKKKHRQTLRFILDAHDKYVLLAPPNREELEYFIGTYHQDKVIAIPNSIPSIVDINIDDKQKVILHVGRLSISQKRSDLLVPFWEIVGRELPDWQFVIVGDGEYLATLRSEIEAKRIERIHVLGKMKPDDYYKKASIFMMPSAFEGFPNTIIEAHSFACPVLAYDSYPALRFIVNDEKDSLLSKAFDVSEMAENAVSLAQSEEKRKAFQLNAQINAKRFLINNVGQIWIDLFNEITA